MRKEPSHAGEASPLIRFWGLALAVKPRLVLTKFGGDTVAQCSGYTVLLEGTMVPAQGGKSAAGFFTVALGTATRSRRDLSVGDLLRGDAHTVPEGHPDTPADLYRVGTLRTIARTGEPGGGHVREPDPPRTDAPLAPDAAEMAPRRALLPENLESDDLCRRCPYGVLVPVVRLSDPRDYRSGRWSQVPACLGPTDCPHFRSRD